MDVKNYSASDLLRQARLRMTQKQIAALLDVSAKTIGRWERGQVHPPLMIVPVLSQALSKSNTGLPNEFTFIDLFAGIGGMRLGFERAGGRCIYTCEWDKWSKKTYLANFGDGHPFAADITEINERDVPPHDVLLAGFPCQPFSIAGVSKKNALGKPHGFECATQGTLFFDVARIIAHRKPHVFLLENVKNLVSHDHGNTFRVILETLRDELGYTVLTRVIDGRSFVPQHRERLLIAGFRRDTGFTWDAFTYPNRSTPVLGDILHTENSYEVAEGEYTVGALAAVNPKYTLSKHLWVYLQNYAAKHRAAGNGFGYGLVGRKDVARTLSARYHKDGSEILINSGKKKNPRRLTPRECARLMGFPESFTIPVSDTQAYRQFGNSVVVPVIQEAARILKPHIVELANQAREESPQRDLFLQSA